MQYKLIKEEQILDLAYRKKIIEEIVGNENIQRKAEALKRYELLKDMIKKYVIAQLANEGLREDTLIQMANRASDISIYKKVINKLARCYNGGVTRISKEAQEQLDQLARLLEVDQKQKNKDRYRQSFKNVATYVVPELSEVESEEELKKYKLKLKVLSPYQYDVIEDYNDHEKPKVFILTDFVERDRFSQPNYMPEGTEGRGLPGVPGVWMAPQRNFKDDIIADDVADQGYCKRTFIWWSDKYHFTTDKEGKIIEEVSPKDFINPIGIKPFVNMSDNPDGEFWAQGGDDLVIGSILINTLLTDLNAIAFIQGHGQLVISGRDIPKDLEGGPYTAMVLNYDEGDPEPKVTFESANPPLDAWMRMIEQHTALLLSTNGLSPSTIAGKLEASNAASGIALLIEQSEATESIEDKQRMFKDDERALWDIVFKWQNYFFDNDALAQEFMEIGKIPEEAEVTVKFNEYKQVLSESEKLQNIKLRKDLGINTMLDLIKIDNPELSDEEAQQKLKEINQDKMDKMAQMMTSAVKTAQPQDQQPPQQDMQSAMVQEMNLNNNYVG